MHSAGFPPCWGHFPKGPPPYWPTRIFLFVFCHSKLSPFVVPDSANLSNCHSHHLGPEPLGAPTDASAASLVIQCWRTVASRPQVRHEGVAHSLRSNSRSGCLVLKLFRIEAFDIAHQCIASQQLTKLSVAELVMAPGKTEASSKRADSRSPDRNLARFYCNPWPNILDVPAKNKHPTGTWTTKFPPVKVIVQNHRIQSAASNHLITFILQFFQPALARTQVNSVTGQTNVNVSQCQRDFLGCFKLLLC